MRVIIGLGNPGEKYTGTRHNIGFEFLDQLKTAWNFPDFQLENKFNAEISKGKLNQQEILLVKPQTFVNLSGNAVLRILNFYKILPENILIIHDDLDLPLGSFRLAEESRSAGHNGVQNIIDQLDTQKFKRIRIGVDIETDLPSEVFVLQKFSDDEKEKIKNVLDKILEEVKKYL